MKSVIASLLTLLIVILMYLGHRWITEGHGLNPSIAFTIVGLSIAYLGVIFYRDLFRH